MKIDTSQVKKGTILNNNGQLVKVVDIAHTHTGRGMATYTFKVKNIINGATNTLTFKASSTLEQAEVMTKNAVYLYNTGDKYFFMENDSGEIHEISENLIEDTKSYLKENLDLFLVMHDEKIISILLPTTITYKIIDTVPGIKGDRASTGKKPAKIETGLDVMIPLHINQGDEVRLNTLTGEIN